MLAERVEEIEKGKESRVAVVVETKKKRKSSAMKKKNRKYRALDEAKRNEHGAGGDGEEDSLEAEDAVLGKPSGHPSRPSPQS